MVETQRRASIKPVHSSPSRVYRPFFSALGLSLAAGCASLLGAALLTGLGMAVVHAGHTTGQITIDYPLNGSVFPPDMVAPTFLWRDPAANAESWQIDVSFANGSAAIRTTSKGERMQLGAIDPRCISNTNKLPELTPEQAAAHTWKPDAATWAAIKKQAGAGAITITLRGFAAASPSAPVSAGTLRMHISADPVGAPIFYRDVPLMPSDAEKGVIKPLAPAAIPLIEWRMRSVADNGSHIVMTDLHSCANCHSFSANGKTLGLDMDGPGNDKGLYAMAPVAKQMTIRNEDMLSWSSFPTESGSPVRVGFMSQVSPDGRHVVTTIRPPGTKSSQFYYVANFKDYRFLQVFYPTRGILAWYDRDAKKLRPLPGADDPRYVQSNAVWSPDGKYLVFSRAEAKDSSPADGKMAEYANDPKEVQIHYDLYRIPFNDGRGGKPEPILGASNNGMSNSFPKISPDGKWLVFVQAKNGQLMRPDGKLYIVPAAGGQARRMNCNTPLMNSWHSFSPNGRWLVFSSKSRSPYTQMFLTHIDESGNDTPAILIENSTAANRAVNIPEFVNMGPNEIEHIDTPAVDFYRQFDVAGELAKKGEYAAAIPEWVKAIAMSPGDARVHDSYGLTLAMAGRTEDAIAEYRKAIAAKAEYPEARNNLGIALARLGQWNAAIEQYRLAIEENPGYALAYNNLGRALAAQGRLDEAVEQYNNALGVNPNFAAAHHDLGMALVKKGQVAEGLAHLREALKREPDNVQMLNDAAWLLATSSDAALRNASEAVRLAEHTAQLTAGHDPGALGTLAAAYAASGDFDRAQDVEQRAADLAGQQGKAQLATELGSRVALFQAKTAIREP